MHFRLYREYGALNSPPVFDAFEQGARSLGYGISMSGASIPVIWSVLWKNRMSGSQQVYRTNPNSIIIEVGNLIRGTSWRIGLRNINALGIFGNDRDLDPSRPEKLGVFLGAVQQTRRPEILIACQHQDSLQWQGQPSMAQWVENTVKEIRKYSDRKIVIRPHPRSPISVKIPGVEIELPNKISGSYDDFDIDYNYHCVVNYNSGPSVQAAIHGVPIICDNTSLAGEISEKMENIENPRLPDRQDWFLKLCHTEWTVEEIRAGIPLKRLERLINC